MHIVTAKLVDEFLSRFAVPRELHSNQGMNFESKAMVGHLEHFHCIHSLTSRGVLQLDIDSNVSMKN